MADNFLEKQYASYEQQKALRAAARRKAWQRRLREYKEKLAREKTAAHDESSDAASAL